MANSPKTKPKKKSSARPLAVVILAAGEGKRMRSRKAKVLHEVAGKPLVTHTLDAVAALSPERTIVVVGHQADQVRDAIGDRGTCVLQKKQLGTGHAVSQAAQILSDAPGDALVLYGDTPFVEADTLHAMQDARSRHDFVVLGFEAKDPGRYGRLIMIGDKLERIVEFKDASVEERAVNFCNSGVILARADRLFEMVNLLEPKNAAQEYYLTDVVELANARGWSCTAIACPEDETMGINSRAELANAEAQFQESRSEFHPSRTQANQSPMLASQYRDSSAELT